VPVFLGTIQTDQSLKVMSENWGPLLPLSWMATLTPLTLETRLSLMSMRWSLRLVLHVIHIQ
ncbi:hypothetical protein, partial [Vibrio mediterranei]